MTRLNKPLMRAFAVLAMASSLIACDKSGIHDLGEATDLLQPFATNGTTWVRSMDDSTEVLVLDNVDPITSGLTGSTQFFQAVVNQNSESHMITGQIQLNAAGDGEALIGLEYDFQFQPTIPVLQRTGAIRDEYDPPRSRAVTITFDAGQLILTMDGETRRMTRLGEVLDRIDVTNQAGLEDMYRAVNIPFYISQSRIIGFGSGGMTAYTTPAIFTGVVSGQYRVSVQGGFRVDTDLTYTEMTDVSEIAINGNNHTDVNLGGDGSNSDSLTFTVTTQTRTVELVVIYDGLQICRGVTCGGSYTVQNGGTDWIVDWSIAQDIQLRNVLPVAESLP